MRFKTGQSLLALAVLVAASSAVANTDLGFVTKQHLDSRGGVDRVSGLLRYEMRGTVTRDGKSQPMHVWFKYPNKLRVDVGRGEDVTTSVFDGQAAWVIEPGPWGKEPAGMAPGLREIFCRQADFAGPLIGCEKKGVKVIPDSKKWGNEGYLFHIERADGYKDELLVDPNLRLAKSEKYQIDDDSYAEQKFSKYRRVEGFAVPGHIERFIDGKLVEVIDVAEFTIGPEMPDKHFAVHAADYSGSLAANLVDLKSLDDLKERYMADEGRVRIVAFLSPTSAEGRKGYLDLQNALKNFNDERLRAYVVWTGVLDTDQRAAAGARASECKDPRVTAFWDQSQAAAGQWSKVVSADHPVWNSYFVNGPTASWDSKPPVPEHWLQGNSLTSTEGGPARVDGFSKVRDMLATMADDSKTGKGTNSKR